MSAVFTNEVGNILEGDIKIAREAKSGVYFAHSEKEKMYARVTGLNQSKTPVDAATRSEITKQYQEANADFTRKEVIFFFFSYIKFNFFEGTYFKFAVFKKSYQLS